MNTIDRIIGFFAPAWGVERATARATLQQINALTGSGKVGYEAGQLTRNTRNRLPSRVNENNLPLEQIERVQGESWQLFRNNPYARKIVRSLESKVIGRGMCPEPQATTADGQADTAFRTRAKQLWHDIQSKFDYRGIPGQGGMTFGGLQRLILRAVMLSGDTLYRLKPLDNAERIRRDSPIPIALQVIDSARLATAHQPLVGDVPDGNYVYRGIEFTSEGVRAAYWVYEIEPGQLIVNYRKVTRVPAAELFHLFVEDDVDQIRGVPWFAPVILQLRDTGDLQYNVLKASAMAACVVLGYRKPTGAQRFGLGQDISSNPDTADGTDLTDSDGNAITKIQPGMFVNLGKDGKLEGFSPNQPTMNAEAFIQHMLRATAGGISGTKSSTVTGDYRNASFSSEKAADNDTWPEVQALQEWFSTSFCQPVYEAVIKAGIVSGYFDGVVSAEEFQQNSARYLPATWQGPIPQSINPEKDAGAAQLRMQAGLSSLPKECAKLGEDWREVLTDAAAVYTFAEGLGLPEEYVNNILGVGSQDTVTEQPDATDTTSTDVPSDATDATDTTDSTSTATEDVNVEAE